MSKFTAQLLKADTANGVQVVGFEDYPDAEVIESTRDFMDQLAGLDDDESVFTQVLPAGTDGEWEMIDEEYGIH